MKLRWPQTVELLHWFRIASVLLPAILFILLAVFTYRTAFSDAADKLAWTSQVAREHAMKVFDSYKLVADHVADVLQGLDEPAIHSDETRLNARDAMRGEGHLAIAASAVAEIPPLRGAAPTRGNHVAVMVRDTGVGIAPHHLEAIFEPFFTTKPKGEGTGPGLSQVFGFAKQSGGEIGVESRVGHGTAFTLYLPQVPPPERQPAGSPESDPHAAIRPHDLCVLVVEDDVQAAATAVAALEDEGYASIHALTADAALRELERDATRFDVVFSDVVMPGMSGIDFGREVRRRHPDLPVVLTSGYSDILAESEDHGFELLHKPYRVAQLSRAILAATQWRQRRRSPETVAG